MGEGKEMTGFVKNFLAVCLKDRTRLSQVIDLIDPSAFEVDPRAHWIVRKIKSFWNQYREPPTIEILRHLLKTDRTIPDEMKTQIGVLIEEIRDLPIDDAESRFAFDSIVEHLIKYNLAIEMIHLKHHIENGSNLSDIRQVINRMQTIANPALSDDLGIDFATVASDPNRMLSLLKQDVGDRIPTGFPALDSYLDGGMPRGTIFIICGTPKAGKTWTLVNLAVRAFLNGYKTVYFTLEIPDSYIFERMLQVAGKIQYDALQKMISTDEFDSIARIISERIEKIKKGKSESAYLRIQQFPSMRTTTRQLDSYIQSYLPSPPDVIVVDYAELVLPSYKIQERRLALGQVVLELRSLGVIHNAVVYTAWQANREALKRELVDELNASESWEVIKHTDVFATITEEDRDDNASPLEDEMNPIVEYTFFLSLSRISSHQKVDLYMRRNKKTGAIEIFSEKLEAGL